MNDDSKPNSKLPKKIPAKFEELRGFEEVIDLLNTDVAKIASRITDDKGLDNYDLYSYLEREYERQQKLDNFFNQGVRHTLNYSPTKTLIQENLDQLFTHKEKITNIIGQAHSPFLKKMQKEWMTAFSDSVKRPK